MLCDSTLESTVNRLSSYEVENAICGYVIVCLLMRFIPSFLFSCADYYICAGNLVGLYPDGQRKPHLCMLVTEVAFVAPPSAGDSSSSTPFPSPRKRRSTTLTPAAGQKELAEGQSPVKKCDDLGTIVILRN